MSIISTARSSKQHIGSVRIGRRRYATDAQVNAVSTVINMLQKAKTAKSESEYFLRLSDAFKAIKELGKEYQP